MDIYKIREVFNQLSLKRKCFKCGCELFNYAEKSYYTVDFEDKRVHEESLERIIQCQNCKSIMFQD